MDESEIQACGLSTDEARGSKDNQKLEVTSKKGFFQIVFHREDSFEELDKACG